MSNSIINPELYDLIVKKKDIKYDTEFKDFKIMKKKVGVIGNGFVGESIAFAFSPTTEVRIFDIDPLRATHTIDEVYECDYVFVCVPTPMDYEGKQDLTFINNVFEVAKSGPIYIIKSTVLPGTTNELVTQYPELDIIFSPEFLTERTAKLDMLTQSRIILGGDEGLTERVKEVFLGRFMNRHIICTDSTTAEFIKYMNNTFFAAKVSLMNEFHRLAEGIGVNWSDAIYGFAADGRVGDSHLHVPGPDGKLGFGGTCFPKDINALIHMANDKGLSMNVLEAAWKTNLEVRPESDWNDLKGRAVSS
jgi:nucleotide sugar dehydrogenase